MGSIEEREGILGMIAEPVMAVNPEKKTSNQVTVIYRTEEGTSSERYTDVISVLLTGSGNWLEIRLKDKIITLSTRAVRKVIEEQVLH